MVASGERDGGETILNPRGHAREGTSLADSVNWLLAHAHGRCGSKWAVNMGASRLRSLRLKGRAALPSCAQT